MYVIDLGMPLTSVKLTIKRKFFRNANLPWFNEKSCSTVRLPWPSMDRARNKQILILDSNVISITVAMLKGYCVMGRPAERMQLPSNDFCRGKRTLLSTLFVNEHHLQVADIG